MPCSFHTSQELCSRKSLSLCLILGSPSSPHCQQIGQREEPAPPSSLPLPLLISSPFPFPLCLFSLVFVGQICSHPLPTSSHTPPHHLLHPRNSLLFQPPPMVAFTLFNFREDDVLQASLACVCSWALALFSYSYWDQFQPLLHVVLSCLVCCTSNQGVVPLPYTTLFI